MAVAAVAEATAAVMTPATPAAAFSTVRLPRRPAAAPTISTMPIAKTKTIGTFVDVDPDGESVYETDSVSFTTGPDGLEIVTDNITYFAEPTPTPEPLPGLELPDRANLVSRSAKTSHSGTSPSPQAQRRRNRPIPVILALLPPPGPSPSLPRTSLSQAAATAGTTRWISRVERVGSRRPQYRARPQPGRTALDHSLCPATARSHAPGRPDTDRAMP